MSDVGHSVARTFVDDAPFMDGKRCRLLGLFATGVSLARAHPYLLGRLSSHNVALRVKKTGGNRSGLTGYRSNWSGPVPVSAGTQPVQIQNLNLNSKNEKSPKNS